MNNLTYVFVAAALAGSVGCGGNVIVFGAGGSTSGTGTTSATGQTNVATSGAGTGTADVGATTGTGGSCQTDADCPATAACIHSDGLCGMGVPGVCETKTFPPCPVQSPACFCDGTVGQPCGTVDISKDPAICSNGTFPCGTVMCKKYLEYCVPPQAQPAGGGPFIGCVPAPPECTYGIVNCECLSANGSPGMCSDDGMGDVTVYQATAG
jgi:hypothetical protein